MSVHVIYMVDGRKMMRPVLTREEYMALRDSEENRRAEKKNMVQMNYSCLPNEDGSLRGAKRMSTTIGADIDLPAEVVQDVQKVQEVQELILSKKDELGLLMLEHSATKGYHVVCRRVPRLSQEVNLKRISGILGVEFDKGAKDITRVFYTPADKLVYLDDEVFRVESGELRDESLKLRDESGEGLMANSEGQTALPASLAAFDLCVKEAGLKAEEMDVWGEHNWHSNLMAVLSVGLPKLMTREQLEAVVRERLPNYSQTEDCRNLIGYFYDKYTADKGFMSVTLRNINAKAQRGVNDNEDDNNNPPTGSGQAEDDDEEMMSELREGWEPPVHPKKLPRLIELLVKPFPEQYHPMLIVTALVVLGAIAGHFRSVYIDGRTIAANLYASLIAGSGKGKNWVTVLFEIMCRHTLQDWDNAEWRKVRENQEMRDRMVNAKDKPAKYHPKFRIMETMSKTSLLEVQTNLGENGMVMCNYTESDELANQSKALFSNLSVLFRKGWDLDVHRQFYMSEASCNTQCRLNAAILLTGTPKSVLSRLFADTENGMMQRFIPLIMPKLRRTFRPPVFTPITAEEEAERDALLMDLWQKDLSLGEQTVELEMPKTKKLVYEWYDELEERYNDGLVSEAEADLSHRIGQFMQRAAIPFVALYGEEHKEMLALVKWLGDFSYYNICHIFGKRVSDDMKESEEILSMRIDNRRKGEPFLARMPEVFTLHQFQEERDRAGQCSESKMLLTRYCKNGRLERIGRGLYRKKSIIVSDTKISEGGSEECRVMIRQTNQPSEELKVKGE